MPNKKQSPKRWDAGRLVLVLPEDSEVKRFILDQAAHNMRTVAGQIRFMLRKVVAEVQGNVRQ